MKGERLVRAFRRGSLTAAIAVMAMVAVTASSAAEISITTKERTSLELRLLQTELMVAALSCSAADRYNAFVTLYRSQLTDGGKTMQNLFKRVHGAQAFSRINSFVTQMANEASLRMVRDTNRFCDDTGTMFEALLGGGKGLENVSHSGAPPRKCRKCDAASRACGRRAAARPWCRLPR